MHSLSVIFYIILLLPAFFFQCLLIFCITNVNSAESFIKEEEEDCMLLSAEYNPCDGTDSLYPQHFHLSVMPPSCDVDWLLTSVPALRNMQASSANVDQFIGCTNSQHEGTPKSANSLDGIPEQCTNSQPTVDMMKPNTTTTQHFTTPTTSGGRFERNGATVVGETPQLTCNSVLPNTNSSVVTEQHRIAPSYTYKFVPFIKPKCQVCGADFLCERYLNTHMTIHTGEKPYKCSFCDKRFRLQDVRRVHELRHKGLLPQCPVCGGRYGNLHTHMMVHSDSNPTHICSVCLKALRTAYGLKSHMLIHSGERPYTCHDCGGCYRTSTHLKSHMRVHIKEKNYGPCNVCGKMFSNSTCLKSHMRTHTDERPYRCETCGKTYKLKITLAVHQTIHSSEKPFVCSTCGKQFRLDQNLRRHKRIHTGEQPYECSVCGMRFNQYDSRKRHMLVHTGEKPYSCSDCGERFTQSGGLNGHRRRHCPVVKNSQN